MISPWARQNFVDHNLTDQYFSDLFPVGGWLVVPVAAFGLFDRRTRSLVAVSLGTVLAYALLFRNGAYDRTAQLPGDS